MEAKYELTRGILQKVVDSQAASLFPKEFSVSILTKSDLVLRDLDLLKRIPGIEVGFSIAMPNEQARRIFEPCCVPVKQRFKALQTLCDNNNINTFAFIGPILPGITDLKMIFALLEGKVVYVFGETLNTHCDNMPQILKAVSAYDQKLRPFFVQAVQDRQYWEAIEQEFHALAKKHDIHVAGFFHHVRKSEA